MSGYRYSIELYPSGKSVWSIGLEKPDFQQALEWGQFEALRAGHLPISGTSVVEPVFFEDGPGVTGFRITVPVAGATFSAAIPRSYFASTAGRYRAAFVKAGRMADEETYHWTMSAWRRDDGVDAESRVTELLVKIEPGSLSSLMSRSTPNRPDDGSHFKVFFPRDVLDETAGMAAAASPMECGGVLLGRLRRDSESGELFQVVTAFVPALSAVATETELRFTPEAWHAVRAAVKLRGQDEIWSGWAHSHTPVSWSDTCGRCPAERQRVCPLATELFSEQDRALHRLFPSFCVALVANVLADGVVHSCFGWRLGTIESRPYYVMENLL